MNQKDFDKLTQSIKQAGRIKEGFTEARSSPEVITPLMFGPFVTSLENPKVSSH